MWEEKSTPRCQTVLLNDLSPEACRVMYAVERVCADSKNGQPRSRFVEEEQYRIQGQGERGEVRSG